MIEQAALDNYIIEALINVGVTHPPFIELAKDKFLKLTFHTNVEDIVTSINNWAKTDDIKNYIQAPINSGGGSRGGADWRSFTDPHDKADWDLWAYIPHCEYFQAVALSLDIEPSKYSHQVKGWPQEYERRLKITKSHLEFKSLARNKTYIDNVDLSVFGTWAQSLGWSLPDKFPKGVDIKAVSEEFSVNNKLVVEGIGTNKSSTIHKIKNRTQILDAEIKTAKETALDKNDPSSVWAELLKMTQNKQGCLLGIDEKHIKFQDGEEVKFFSKKNLSDRMTRANTR